MRLMGKVGGICGYFIEKMLRVARVEITQADMADGILDVIFVHIRVAFYCTGAEFLEAAGKISLLGEFRDRHCSFGLRIA
jgi:hypothetical protein